MTVQQIADLEGVSTRQIQRYCSAGYKGIILQAVRIGRAWEIAEEDYKDWRVLCGFDKPAPCTNSVQRPASSTESVDHPPAPCAEYPPWPQPAFPGGPLTNQPHETSGNWPHPEAVKQHEQELLRAQMARLRGYSNDNE